MRFPFQCCVASSFFSFCFRFLLFRDEHYFFFLLFIVDVFSASLAIFIAIVVVILILHLLVFSSSARRSLSFRLSVVYFFLMLFFTVRPFSVISLCLSCCSIGCIVLALWVVVFVSQSISSSFRFASFSIWSGLKLHFAYAALPYFNPTNPIAEYQNSTYSTFNYIQ